MIRTYLHNDITYEIQVFGNDIHLQSPSHDLIIVKGYSDLMIDAIDRLRCQSIDQYVDEHIESFIEQNIDKAKTVNN